MGFRRRPYKCGVCGECARPVPNLPSLSDHYGMKATYPRGQTCSKELSPTSYTVKGWFRTHTHTLTWETGRVRGVVWHELELLLIVGTWGPNPTSASRVEQAWAAASLREQEIRRNREDPLVLFALASHRTLCCRRHAQAELRHLAETHGLEEQLLTRPLELPDEYRQPAYG